MRILLSTLALFLALDPRVGTAALLKTGDQFPPWTLKADTGATMSSNDLAGKTYVLWFFPKAMTPGCTAEGRSFRDEAGAFQEQGVTILGVSFDTPADNAAFVKAEGFPFRLLSDQDHALALATGAADSASAPVAHRISFVVGPDGKVRQVYGTVNPASHAKDVLTDLHKQ
jgi:thioredoxin-dependent peroxiredoxin